ncbi:MAG: 1,4-dihydroxy-2-naphthoate polyprenyltransferase [Bacteroidota bacterium]
MNNTRAFVSAARLRTLPLSVSGILTGTALAVSEGVFSWSIFILAVLTTIGFQVLSNFANDYGDGVKGTDNMHRVGPKRALQSGTISPKAMKRAIVITILFTLLTAIALIYRAFGTENIMYSLLFFVLGIAAIVAAIKYTVGKSAYGYHGWGDVFVFLFFGWVSVVGAYFLYVRQWQWNVLLPATTIGLLSVAVLNLNNMRDRESDALSGKHTLVVMLGAVYAKYYHFCLIILALLAVVSYTLITWQSVYHFLYLLSFFSIVFHVITVLKTKDHRTLDPELKKLALSTFLFSILFLVGKLL